MYTSSSDVGLDIATYHISIFKLLLELRFRPLLVVGDHKGVAAVLQELPEPQLIFKAACA